MNRICTLTPLPWLNPEDESEFLIEIAANSQSLRLGLKAQALWELE